MDNNKKILGLRHSEGEDNGRKYDNFIFFVGYNNPLTCSSSEGIGSIFTDRVKVPSSQVQQFIDDLGLSDESGFLGLSVSQVYYDQYRNAVSFSFINDDFDL